MPSVKNPNGPSKNRLAARRATARSKTQKQTAQASKNKIAKADATRGARAGLLPNSGPRAALSSKKRRKLERKMGYALQRKFERDGEVLMEDVPEETDENETKEKKAGTEAAEEQMAVDTEEIS
ncbi:Uu.00g051150.m01.CDS01 [Anthostomella pinea]|uniref:Uu.00g051150.m01.CDS01 n=1 Tax=Anthostomella pinea TaxID=933095 RepID=A0AAI8YMP1_9PEZI|nr:Uu.00g051150.m01.CDS01 [Anthostomella pinea]